MSVSSLTAAVVVAVAPFAAELWHGSALDDFGWWLPRGCAAALLVALGWVWSLTTLTTTELLLSAEHRTRLVQRSAHGTSTADVVRRVVIALCGLGLSASVLSPAHADDTGRGLHGGQGRAQPSIAGLPFPQQPVAPSFVAPGARPPAATPGPSQLHSPTREPSQTLREADPATAPRSQPPRTQAPSVPPTTAVTPSTSAASGTVVVVAGDTLWDLAARDLGTRDAAAISQRWHEIYLANRDVIGPDPDHLLPATRLVLPPTGHAH